MITRLWNATAAVALCLALLTLGCTKWAEKNNPNWHEATSGERLANLFWNDVKEKKWQQLGTHIAPEFAGANARQTLDKTALLDHVSHLNVESFQIGEVETRPAGGDLLVSYVITLRTKPSNGAPAEIHLRVLSVWQELKHGWVVVAMSGTRTSAAPTP